MSEPIVLKEKNLPSECYVYKHSTRCSVCSFTANEIKAASYALPLYWINVIEQRELSNWFADNFGVKHQSPQLILIEQGTPAKVWNHAEIRRELLR